MKRVLFWLVMIGAAATLAQAQTTDQAPPTPTLAPVIAPNPDATATPPPPLDLRLWWVDTLAPQEGESSNLRAAQLQAITRLNAGIRVEVRLKTADGPGGIREALLAADAVAPTALPDLALIARRDLPALIDAGLAQPIDNHLSEVDQVRFYPVALALGEFSGRQYALPYALDLHHLVYAPPAADLATFAGSLSAGRPLLLPLAGEALTPAVLAQYLSCGGRLIDGQLAQLEEAPLRTLLEYYAQATIDPRSTEYASLHDTLPLLDGREPIAGLVNTAGYQRVLSILPNLELSTPPLSENPVTVVDGWVWVLLTTEPDRLNAALTVINGLVETEALEASTVSVGVLPATPAALARWTDQVYAAFAADQLLDALPMPRDGGGQAGAWLMAAVRQVVNGGTVAEAVTEAVSAP
jgi:ABC-type glycerol-3-phosphate transport system substrate-binding protein